MFVGHTWSKCKSNDELGIGMWVAGKGKGYGEFGWKMTIPRSKVVPEFEDRAMSYRNWGHGEPDLRSKACLAVSRKDGFKWYDQPCDQKYCFICEDRRHPV